MQGLMQDWPLTVDKILDHGANWHAEREVVTRSLEGGIVRTNYGEIRTRAKKLSNALLAHGITPGDRVATLAFNTHRHIEAWYAVMGIGAVCHTLNPRLFAEQLIYIVNHAEDRIILADAVNAPILANILPHCPTVEKIVWLTDDAHLPKDGPAGVAYERYIGDQSDTCVWGDFAEQTAAGLCYTSGTTGNPKGVLYSHRSNYLHTLFSLQADVQGLVGGGQCAGGGAHVPRQRLGADLLRPGGGRQACFARQPDGRRLDPRTPADGRGHGIGGGAHRVPDAASAPRRHRREVAAPEEGADRRFGLSGEHHPRLQRPLWGGGAAPVGHDGDVARGHGRRAVRQGRRVELRRADALPPEAGPHAARRRNEAD